MPGKSQSGQKDTRRSGKQMQQGNLGQKEAQQQQEKESELRQMGDVHESNPNQTNKQQSD
jgi:hypothetical protein